MIRYEYGCSSCGHTFEMDLPVDKRDDPTFGLCQKCDGSIRRILHAPPFKLKGDCWERDGYIRDTDKAEHYNKLAEE